MVTQKDYIMLFSVLILCIAQLMKDLFKAESAHQHTSKIYSRSIEQSKLLPTTAMEMHQKESSFTIFSKENES